MYNSSIVWTTEETVTVAQAGCGYHYIGMMQQNAMSYHKSTTMYKSSSDCTTEGVVTVALTGCGYHYIGVMR